jgi:hypothetical protein
MHKPERPLSLERKNHLAQRPIAGSNRSALLGLSRATPPQSGSVPVRAANRAILPRPRRRLAAQSVGLPYTIANLLQYDSHWGIDFVHDCFMA